MPLIAAGQFSTRTFFAMIALIRSLHWIKNGFVLAPIFFSAQIKNAAMMQLAFCATIVFCLVSSAIYVFNDWCDIEADRVHATKRFRPLATGVVSLKAAFILLILLAVIASTVIIYAKLSFSFCAAVLVFIIINVCYSLGLKHIALLELFLVASGYVIRLIAGSVATHIDLSPWIISETGLIALLLCTGKRRGDIVQSHDPSRMRKSLQEYNLAFLDITLGLLAAATLVIYLLFCVSSYAYSRYGVSVLATAIPVAFGILRFLQVVIVKGGGDNPADLVLRDRFLSLNIGIFVIMFSVLIYS